MVFSVDVCLSLLLFVSLVFTYAVSVATQSQWTSGGGGSPTTIDAPPGNTLKHLTQAKSVGRSVGTYMLRTTAGNYGVFPCLSCVPFRVMGPDLTNTCSVTLFTFFFLFRRQPTDLPMSASAARSRCYRNLPPTPRLSHLPACKDSSPLTDWGSPIKQVYYDSSRLIKPPYLRR